MINYKKLWQFAYDVFLAVGMTTEDASLAANVLLSADLRGIDSHGVARLKGYVRLMDEGRANARPQITIDYQTPSTATVNGDKGLGLVVGPKAMQIAIEKAENAGTGWVAVNNSNHFGIAGYHTLLAVQHRMMGFAMTNASPLVAPTWGKKRMLGTNPISFAVPAGANPPIVVDMATTTAANGKLEILQRKQKDAPDGWIQDADGKVINDPFGVQKGGALLPLGSDFDHGSHKGYCLGAMVDILSGVLSGANYGPWVPPFVSFLKPVDAPVGKGIGHFFGAMRVDAFRPSDEFLQHIDNWITAFRATTPVEGYEKVLIPGDPERISEEKRRAEGISLLPPVLSDLNELSVRFAIPL